MNEWKDGSLEKGQTFLPGAGLGLTGNGSEEEASRRSWLTQGLVFEGAAGLGVVQCWLTGSASLERGLLTVRERCPHSHLRVPISGEPPGLGRRAGWSEVGASFGAWLGNLARVMASALDWVVEAHSWFYTLDQHRRVKNSDENPGLPLASWLLGLFCTKEIRLEKTGYDCCIFLNWFKSWERPG